MAKIKWKMRQNARNFDEAEICGRMRENADSVIPPCPAAIPEGWCGSGEGSASPARAPEARGWTPRGGLDDTTECGRLQGLLPYGVVGGGASTFGTAEGSHPGALYTPPAAGRWGPWWGHRRRGRSPARGPGG